MPWPCFIVADLSEAENPGALYPHEREGQTDWYVVLPNGAIHNINAKFSDGSSWAVSGEAPNFTVSPSINCYPSRNRQGWHGYLTNGVLTDDLDGSTYREEE
jgi:hypothetical protein